MLMVFGANGPSGRALLQRLQGRLPLLAALRQPAADDDFFQRLHIPTDVADALHAHACAQLVQRHRPTAAVSFIGGKNAQGVRSDATGNRHLIQALRQHAPTARFVLVTSMGCGEQWAQTSDAFKKFLGEAVQAKTQAEDLLRQQDAAHGLRWTILRPCGLNDGEGDAFILHTDPATPMPGHYMSRRALAAAVAEVLSDDARIGQVCSVTSPQP